MKRLSSSTVLFLIGFAIVVISNIMALSGVALNRMGTEETRIILSNRELSLDWSSRENSGLSMSLDWRVLNTESWDIYGSGRWSELAWLNEEKLSALGFDVGKLRNYLDPKTGKIKRPLVKKAYIVLELGGQPYAEAVKRAEDYLAKAKKDKDESEIEHILKRITGVRESDSRLFAIDAGIDPVSLRRQYSDKSRFLILKGVIEPRLYGSILLGRIKSLGVESMHVPLAIRDSFDADRESRFSVELVVGARYEPWIESIHPMNGETPTE